MGSANFEIPNNHVSEMIDLLEDHNDEEDVHSLFSRAFRECEDSDIENRLPVNQVILGELLISIADATAEDFGMLVGDDGLSLKNRFYNNIKIHSSFRHITDSISHMSDPIIFGTQILIIMRCISKMKNDSRPENKLPQNGMVEFDKFKSHIFDLFDNICNDFRRKNKNISTEDIDLAKIALSSIILLKSSEKDGIKQIYYTIKKYIDIDIFKPFLSNVLSPVFMLYIDSIEHDSQNYVLDQVSNLFNKSDNTFSTAPKNTELVILEEFNNNVFNSCILAPSIQKSSSALSIKIIEEFDFFISNTFKGKMKSQKIRTGIAEIRSLLSSYKISVQSKNQIYVLLYIIKSIKIMVDDNGSNDIDEKITNLKANVKKQIDSDQLNSATETIEIIKTLLKKSENTLITDLLSLGTELKKIKVIDIPGTSNEESISEENDELCHLLEIDNGELESKLSKSREETISLQRVNDELTQRLTDKDTNASLFRSLMFGNPTITEVITGIKLFYPHVIWNDNIDEQLKSCMFSDPKKVFKILDIICGPYHQTIISGKPDSEAKLVFPCNGYSQNESKSVRNNKKLFNKRKFKINGTLQQFSKHYTIGGDFNEKKCCQIYFNLTENKKLIIGYIGSHLPL